MMHNTIHAPVCAIMHLFVTYHTKILSTVCQLYRGVPRSLHSEFAVCGSSLLTVHITIAVRDTDAKNVSSVEQNGRLLLYGDFSN